MITEDINLDRWLLRGGTALVAIVLLCVVAIQLVLAAQQQRVISGLQAEVEMARDAHGAAKDGQEKCYTALQKADAQLEMVDQWMKIAAGGRK